MFIYTHKKSKPAAKHCLLYVDFTAYQQYVQEYVVVLVYVS